MAKSRVDEIREGGRPRRVPKTYRILDDWEPKEPTEVAAGWDEEQLSEVREVCGDIETAFSYHPLPEHEYYDDDVLDDLFPVAAGLRTASQHWSDLKNCYYQLRNGVDTDRQLVYTFARCAEAITPNDLTHEQSVPKIAQHMRAMQYGVHQRAVGQNREWSEAYIAKLLSEARAYISGSPLLTFDQARKSAALTYTPQRRIHYVSTCLGGVIEEAA